MKNTAAEFLSKDYMTFDAGVITNMTVWAFFKLDNTGRFHTNVTILRAYTGGDACDLH